MANLERTAILLRVIVDISARHLTRIDLLLADYLSDLVQIFLSLIVIGHGLNLSHSGTTIISLQCLADGRLTITHALDQLRQLALGVSSVHLRRLALMS